MSNIKELLVSTIKEWVDCERKIKEFNTLANDGKIVHRTSKTKAPVSKQYLSQILEKYFENNPEVNCDDVGNAILENRPIKERHSIVMKQNK